MRTEVSGVIMRIYRKEKEVTKSGDTIRIYELSDEIYFYDHGVEKVLTDVEIEQIRVALLK